MTLHIYTQTFVGIHKHDTHTLYRRIHYSLCSSSFKRKNLHMIFLPPPLLPMMMDEQRKKKKGGAIYQYTSNVRNIFFLSFSHVPPILFPTPRHICIYIEELNHVYRPERGIPLDSKLYTCYARDPSCFACTRKAARFLFLFVSLSKNSYLIKLSVTLAAILVAAQTHSSFLFEKQNRILEIYRRRGGWLRSSNCYFSRSDDVLTTPVYPSISIYIYTCLMGVVHTQTQTHNRKI